MARRRRSNPLWLTLTLVAIGLAMAQHDRCQRQGGTAVEPERPRDGRTADGPRPGGDRANVGLGAPGPASADGSAPERYLIERPQYVLSYNAPLGLPNWVAWHLDAADLGETGRGRFAPDPRLPAGMYRVTPKDYTGSGFDRGHMCPSGDRTANRADNDAVFLMTNIVPQAPANNQGAWNDFEVYCRALARSGSELYVAAGPAGPFTRRIGNGRVAVPSSVWKVVVVLPDEGDDVARVGAGARVIAVSMPNDASAKGRDWRSFRVSVDAVEAATGLDFMPAVPAPAQEALEARVDDRR
jgi:endonuclease G, mitochondrial